MSDPFLNVPQFLTLSYTASPKPEIPIRFQFGYSPDKASLGEPGKSAGDLLLIKEGNTAVLQVSLGMKGKCTSDTLRKAGGIAGKWLLANPVAEILLRAADLDSLNIPNGLSAFLEGLRLGAYRFIHYKKSENNSAIQVLVTAEGNSAETSLLVEQASIRTDAVLLAREWAHEPANVINPVTLAALAESVAEPLGLKCLVLDDQDLEALNAGAILAVGRGSRTPPRLIILEYPGTGSAGDSKPVVLVGKAITFDTGGYSLKGVEHIQGMKYDKSGGVAVIATLVAAARLKLRTPIVGVIAAAENMISSASYRPDDIITSLSGKTIEIISTDAEGRLVLADALTYTQRIYQPGAIIDIATLTGGVVTALGHVRAGIMGNQSELIQALIASGETTMERLWQLPLDDEYLPQTTGDDADLKNSGGREGAPIMGGIFLKQFVDPSVPWAHLDIAGVADSTKDGPYQPKGATGFGVRLLIDYLQNL